MINSLQTLRGIAALMIFAHHFGFQSTVTESFGDCAVAIFMMLSGFVLTLSFVARSDSPKPVPKFSQFFTKRLIRIYPLYLLGQLSVFALIKFKIGASKVAADLLMLQSWIPSSDYYFSGNSPSWFVSDLLFCYLLFIPAIKLITERRRAAITILALMLSIYFICITLLPDNLVHSIIYIFPPMQFPVFAIGMLGAIIITKTHSVKPSVCADAFMLMPIVLLIFQIYAYPYISPRLSLSSYWWIASFSLIYMLTRYDKARCVITTVFHIPLLTKLGDISYAFYIFHLPFLYVWRPLLRHFYIELPIGIDFVISAVLLAGICYAIHRLVEVPVTKFLDNRVLRRG
ncbi:MAG: acyltransferase [Muribaculaceae bacterium]|nr:acyltransferase [Muribaculaceae bacterium]